MGFPRNGSASFRNIRRRRRRRKIKLSQTNHEKLKKPERENIKRNGDMSRQTWKVEGRYHSRS